MLLQLKPLFFFFFLNFMFWSWWTFHGAVSDPQTRLVTTGCSKYNFTKVSIFNETLNTTFRDIRAQVTNQSKHFATAQPAKGDNPVHTLFQCRNYLSVADCVACFSAAAGEIRNCSVGASGARVIYDGCFLRYESNGFFDQATDPSNNMYCGNQTVGKAITAVTQQVLMNLQIVTPRIPGFFAATKMQVPIPNGPTIYAFAQCVETVTPSGCLDCLKIGYKNLQICLNNSYGQAYDAGCFMRYSTTSFFADNQTIDITPFLKQGGSSKKGAIIGGVVGGVSLILILLAFFAWLKRSRRPKRVPRGEKKGSLNWKQRYDIILGTARGLAYLHEEFHVCVIHRDIKTSNILLDDNLQPRIADFGLARLLPGDQSHLNTKFARTLGYTAPEYAIHGQLSEKADTYSYGVVVLEIISGQKSREFKDDAEGEFLLQRAWKLYERDMHIEMVDNTLDANFYDVEEAKKIIEIGLLCTQASAASRPTMSEVVVLLKT